MKILHVFSHLLILSFAHDLLAYEGASKPIEISQARDAAYISAPAISIPLKKGEPIEYYSMTLVPNEELSKELGPGALKDRRFSKELIEKGDTLEINAYLIADRANEAFDKVEKGPDVPVFERIKEAFNEKDTDKFLTYIKKLAEQRKGATTIKQLKEMAQGFGKNPDNSLALDAYSLNLFFSLCDAAKEQAKRVKKLIQDEGIDCSKQASLLKGILIKGRR